MGLSTIILAATLSFSNPDSLNYQNKSIMQQQRPQVNMSFLHPKTVTVDDNLPPIFTDAQKLYDKIRGYFIIQKDDYFLLEIHEDGFKAKWYVGRKEK